MVNKPSPASPNVKSVLKKMGNVKIDGNEKKSKEDQKHNTVLNSFINELKELFSDRVNVIILASSIIISSVTVGGIVYYERNKTQEKPTLSEEEIPQRKVKKIIPEEPIVEEKKEVPVKQEEIQEEKRNTDSRKEALKEEVLNTGTASISGPDDVKNIVDIINEMNKTEKRK